MKVLIIEDNPGNMKHTASLMKMSGHDVLQASDAQIGIEMARTDQPSLILINIQLPVMDGLTTTRLLKQDDRTRHIKIIALTAYAMRGDRELILRAGCDGYMFNPVSYRELFYIVKPSFKLESSNSESSFNKD